MTTFDTAHDRPLGRTGLTVSDVSMGASALGRDVEVGQPPSESAIETALEMLHGPFRLADTSNAYGDGRSETVLGAALARIGGIPDGRIVASKADSDPATGDFSYDRILRSFDETTSRLGVDHLPVYHLHDPYTISFEEATAPGGAVAALTRLRDEGRVDHLGIAAGTLSLVNRYVDTGVFDLVLTHNRYTLLNRSAAPSIARWAAQGIGVFNAAPFGGGLLAKGTAATKNYAYQPAKPEVLAWVERLERICADRSVPLPAAAIRFSTRNPDVSSTVVGTANAERVAATRTLADHEIPDDFWHEVDALGEPPVDFGTD